MLKAGHKTMKPREKLTENICYETTCTTHQKQKVSTGVCDHPGPKLVDVIKQDLTQFMVTLKERKC